MRTQSDRVRHAIGFEVVALILSIPIMSYFFEFSMADISVIAIAGSIIAAFWNFGFNLVFDHILLSIRHNTAKTPKIRLVHVLLFEGGLLALYLPMVAWYLEITLWEAFLMDASLVGFYLVYTFSYNWLYDKIFPDPHFDYQFASEPAHECS